MLADDGAWVQMVEIYSCGKKFDVFSEVEPCLFTLNISVNSSLIIKINDSFGILMTSRKLSMIFEFDEKVIETELT